MRAETGKVLIPATLPCFFPLDSKDPKRYLSLSLSVVQPSPFSLSDTTLLYHPLFPSLFLGEIAQ